MKKSVIFSLALIGCFFISGLSGQANTPLAPKKIEKRIPPKNFKWEKLGTRTVNMKADHDEILVTAAEGVFTALKFKVFKAPIYVKNIKVVFGNGQKQVFQVNRKFAAGHESKVIDLKGNKRIIKKIVFNYKSVPTPKGKAVITAFGRH